MILNLGINNPGITYEVALEVLGQRMQPFIMAIIEGVPQNSEKIVR